MLRRALVSVLAVVMTMPVSAQPFWPAKPVRIIVPYPPGGPSEIMVRLVGEKMQATLKQPFVLENRQGAGGNIGAAEVARAAGDGYTWLVSTDALITVNPHVYKQLGFSIDDLVPVTVGTMFSQTLVCNPASPDGGMSMSTPPIAMIGPIASLRS